MARQARGETEPIPYESGAPTGKMATYSHMRYNIAKDVAYNVIAAAKDVKVPLLILDAGQEELMDIRENGGRVAEILKANGTPVKYYVFDDIGHYGVYSTRLAAAVEMELDWFGQHLKAAR